VNSNKIILDLCGGTGAWSRPYAKAGYDVRNITLPYYDVTDYCLREELADLKPYGILAAPPCTMFSLARQRAKTPRDFRQGMNVVISCLEIIWECQYKTKLKFWALENPRGYLRRFLGKPVFVFDPCDFGHDYTKKTDLWGYFNNPKKKRVKPSKPKFDYILTKDIHPEYYGKLSRQVRRAITPSGFAQAFFEANP